MEQTPIWCSNGVHRAAYGGYAGRLSRLVSAGSNADERDSNGTTPLMLASGRGHARCTKLLLKVGAAVEASDKDGCTPLYMAAMNGHLATTNLLLAADANLFAPSVSKLVPFHEAATKGKVEVMKAHVLAGMNVDYHVSGGPTALYCATEHHQIEALTFLLERGANPAFSLRGFTPLETASRTEGCGNTVRKLIAMVGLEKCGGRLGNGGDALHRAAMCGKEDVMDILYTAGARDVHGWALRAAVNFGGGEHAVKFLLKRPPYPLRIYVNMTVAGVKDTPPLLLEYLTKDTLRLSSTRVLRFLLDAGADTTFPLLGIIDTSISLCSTESEKQAMLAKRRLLMREDAVHAISWGWVISSKTTAGNPVKLQPMSRRRERSATTSRVLRGALNR